MPDPQTPPTSPETGTGRDGGRETVGNDTRVILSPQDGSTAAETLAAWRAAEAALSRATHGDDPTTWAGTPWWHVHQLLRVLTALGLTVVDGPIGQEQADG